MWFYFRCPRAGHKGFSYPLHPFIFPFQCIFYAKYKEFSSTRFLMYFLWIFWFVTRLMTVDVYGEHTPWAQAHKSSKAIA